MSLTVGTYLVEMSFTPPFATPSWVDITQYVRQGSVREGTQHEMQRVEPSVATVTLDNRDARFNPWNTSSPYAGLGGTGLVPQMPFRILNTVSAVQYPVFYGYVDSWLPAWNDPAAMGSDMVIQATDIFGMLAINEYTGGAYARTILGDTPYTYLRFDDTPGSTVAADSSGNGYNATFNTPVTFGIAGALLSDVDTAVDIPQPADFYYNATLSTPVTATAWTFEFWMASTSTNAYVVQVVDSTTSRLQFGFSSSTTFFVSLMNGGGSINATGLTITDGKWHHWCLTLASDLQTMVLYRDGQQVASAVSGTAYALSVGPAIYLGASGYNNTADIQIDEFAYYTYALTAAQVATHYAIASDTFAVQTSGSRIAEVLNIAGVPAGLQNIATGISEIQGSTTSLVGNKLGQYLLTINLTENGLLFQDPTGVVVFRDRHWEITNSAALTSQATFENAVAATFFYLIDQFAPGLDNLDLWNEVVVAAQAGPGTPPNPSGAVQAYENPASQTQYGKRTYPPLSGLLMTTDAEALDLAQWVGTHYSTPVQRIRSIKMNNAINQGACLPQMLGRNLFERVTVIYHDPNGGTAFQQDALIEGREHTFSVDTWETIFRLSPAGTQSYLVLNDATHGTLAATSAAGNRMGY